MEKYFITLKVPKGYMNFSISKTNRFIGDTNNSENWDTISFPLPEGKWSIYSVNSSNEVKLKLDEMDLRKRKIKKILNNIDG
jgi:hypothetical protein